MTSWTNASQNIGGCWFREDAEPGDLVCSDGRRNEGAGRRGTSCSGLEGHCRAVRGVFVADTGTKIPLEGCWLRRCLMRAHCWETRGATSELEIWTWSRSETHPAPLCPEMFIVAYFFISNCRLRRNQHGGPQQRRDGSARRRRRCSFAAATPQIIICNQRARG